MDSAEPIRVLFVCAENAARSKMAEGILRAWGGDAHVAFSAGSMPGDVHPTARAVMADWGLSLDTHRSESIAAYQGETMDYVVTLCDRTRDVSPSLRATEMVIHQPFDDPAAVPPADQRAAFEAVRDALAAWIVRVFDVVPPDDYPTTSVEAASGTVTGTAVSA